MLVEEIITTCYTKLYQLYFNEKVFKITLICQTLMNIIFVYKAFENYSEFTLRGNYVCIGDQPVIINNQEEASINCPHVKNCIDLVGFVNNLNNEYFRAITLIFIIITIFASIIWNGIKLIYKCLFTNDNKRIPSFLRVLQLLQSFELIQVWNLLSYAALSYPINGINYGNCLTGKGLNLVLLFSDRETAFIFMNIEVLLAPIIIPFAGLLLVQLQKNQAQELARGRFRIHQGDIYPIHPVLMLFCYLIASTVIFSCFYFIFGSGNLAIIIMSTLNVLIHIYQCFYIKRMLKEFYQKKFLNQVVVEFKIINANNEDLQDPIANEASNAPQINQRRRSIKFPKNSSSSNHHQNHIVPIESMKKDIPQENIQLSLDSNRPISNQEQQDYRQYDDVANEKEIVQFKEM